MIRWDLLANPVNWAIVVLMLAFGAVAVTIVYQGLQGKGL